MKHAKNKQCQIIITLLYLKNAFGQVDDKLLLKVLEYLHIPDEIKLLMTDCYKYYTITIGTDTYIIDLRIVGKGVLQGGCLSPLLFNMVINIIIKTIPSQWTHLRRFTIDSTSKFHAESSSRFHQFWKANPRGNYDIHSTWKFQRGFHFQNRRNIDEFSMRIFLCRFDVEST